MRTIEAIIVALAVATSTVTFRIADAASHSVSDTLYRWVVPELAVLLLAAVSIAAARRARRR